MCISDPGSSRPGIDVEILLISIPCARPTVVAHFTELVNRLVVSIEVVFAQLDPVSHHMTGLILVLRRTETLLAVVPRSVSAGIKDVIGFDHESRHRLD